MSVEEMEKPENMAAFFDARAAGYDDHMRDNIFSDTTFNNSIRLYLFLSKEPTNLLMSWILGAERGWSSRHSFRECQMH